MNTYITVVSKVPNTLIIQGHIEKQDTHILLKLKNISSIIDKLRATLAGKRLECGMLPAVLKTQKMSIVMKFMVSQTRTKKVNQTSNSPLTLFFPDDHDELMTCLEDTGKLPKAEKI